MLKTFGLAAIAALTIGAGSAEAALVTLNNTGDSATFSYSGASTTPACSACLAEVEVTLLANNKLQFDFINKSTDGTTPSPLNILTAFGFSFTPNIDFGGASATFSSGLDWKIGNAGMGNLEFQAGADNGVNDGLDAGQFGSITVTLATGKTISTPLDIDSTSVHFQALSNGGSIKPTGSICTVGCSGGGDPGTPTPDGGMTLSLLGFALAGMGVLARRVR